MTQEEHICEIGRRMYARELVAATDGNISVRTDNGIIITPSLMNKGFMTPCDLLLIDMNGSVIKGNKKPSSELKMHLAIYKERQDINAVVHAHPVAASAFAINGRAINQRYMAEAVMTLGVIPVAPYAQPSTDEVAKSLIPFIKGHNGVLLANHGAVTWGRDLTEAHNFMEQLEFYCKTVILAEMIGTPKSLP